MFNKAFGQDYIIIVALVAFIVASILSNTMIPWVAITSGLVCGIGIPRFFFKSKWASIDAPEWKKYLVVFLVSLVFSQSGWFALLIN